MARRIFVLMTLVLAVFVFTGCSSGTKSVIHENLSLPTKKEDLPTYLRYFVPKGYSEKKFNITLTPSDSIEGSYLINLDLRSDSLTEERALNIARDFIFATFKASTINKLPIVYTSVNVNRENGESFLSVGVGKKIIEQLSLETLKNGNMEAYDFAKWAKGNRQQNEIDGKVFHDGCCVISRP